MQNPGSTRTRRRALRTLLTLAACGATTQASAGDQVSDIHPAPEALRYCVVCHGVELMGNRAVDAPKLAGLPDWYLERQLQAFREGWRGSDASDPNGMEMRPQATVLEDDTVAAAVAFAASVPAHPAAASVIGDAARGERLYQSCAACHGPDGAGSEAQLAPPLAGQNDWYLVTQLEHFRSGARGVASGDTQGAVMRAAALSLANDADIADVVAYIYTFRSKTE